MCLAGVMFAHNPMEPGCERFYREARCDLYPAIG